MTEAEEVNGAKRRRIVNRPRPIVSCLSCRSRKLKCDREQPCQQCLRAGRASTCSYATGSGSPPDTTRQSAPGDIVSSPRNEPPLSERAPSIHPRPAWRPSPAQSTSEIRDRSVDVDYKRRLPDHPAPPEPRNVRPAERLKLNGNRTRYSQADMKRALLQMVSRFSNSMALCPVLSFHTVPRSRKVWW